MQEQSHISIRDSCKDDRRDRSNLELPPQALVLQGARASDLAGERSQAPGKARWKGQPSSVPIGQR